MKLVLALVTPTNADHDVATMIFVIITKKKKPNIKKHSVNRPAITPSPTEMPRDNI